MRHAQSEFNVGITDIEDCNITKNGKLAASDIQGHYDIVICSNLKRTEQTLLATKIIYGKIYYTSLCTEVHDKTEYEIKIQKKDFLKYLLQFQNLKVLIISHGLFIRRLLDLPYRVENLSQHKFAFSNSDLSLIQGPF